MKKRVISHYSRAAGARIIFEFDAEDVRPTEALARLFAESVYRLIEENPWDGAPPTSVAYAWSIASIVGHAIKVVGSKKPKMPAQEFIDVVTDAVQNFYGKKSN